jgi:creatinine amidohydrolase/Fe(II)-dependent formamide hydrolase-like protein
MRSSWKVLAAFVRELFILGCVLAVVSRRSDAQVRRLAELNTRDIRALERDRTVVLLPFGILEEHGPYLPSYTDGYAAEALTRELADTLSSRGWTVLVFPLLPLGHGGANVIGGKYVFPGSYTVRASTLRAVAMDLLTEFGEQQFRRVIAISPHGAPDNSRMLAEAGRYYKDEFNGRMLNLFDAIVLKNDPAAIFPESTRARDGFSVHAGLRETSDVMYLRPELVAPDVKDAPAVRGDSMGDLVRLARAPNWPGYFGAPYLADALHGENSWRQFVSLAIRASVRFLDGQEPEGPLYTDIMAHDVTTSAVERGSQLRDRAIAARQKRWAQRNGLRF